MNIEFYKKCDMLLNILPNERIMEIKEVAEILNVDGHYAQTVVDRLRTDKLAEGVGWGPVSCNDATYTFKDFYKEKIKEIKRAHRTEVRANWALVFGIIGAIGVIARILSLLIQFLKSL